jgi:hypothetical protein
MRGADLSKQPQKSLILDVPPDWQLAIRSRRCGICGEEREVGTTINIGQDVFTLSARKAPALMPGMDSAMLRRFDAFTTS